MPLRDNAGKSMRPPVHIRQQGEPPGPSLSQSARSHWIDLFKGLAILFILINHTEMLVCQPWFLSNFCYKPTGLVTSAEVFIFLSGLLMGYAYLPVLKSKGFGASLKKAAKRSLQLYYYHLLSLIFSLAAIWFFIDLIAPVPVPECLTPFFSDLWPSLFRFATLTMFTGFFEILAAYIFFLMLTAFLLPLFRTSPLIPWAVALALYLGSNFLTKLGFHDLVHPVGMFINPFAWYLLFFIGACLGIKKSEGTLLIPTSNIVLYLAIALVAVIFVNYKLIPVFNFFALGLDTEPLFQMRGISRSDLGPTRLLNFLALALIAHRLFSARELPMRNLLIRGFCHCGRFSLEVFALGLVLTYVNYCLYLWLGGGGATLVAVELGSVALSMALAFYLASRKAGPVPQPIPRQAGAPGP